MNEMMVCGDDEGRGGGCLRLNVITVSKPCGI